MEEIIMLTSDQMSNLEATEREVNDREFLIKTAIDIQAAYVIPQPIFATIIINAEAPSHIAIKIYIIYLSFFQSFLNEWEKI